MGKHTDVSLLLTDIQIMQIFEGLGHKLFQDSCLGFDLSQLVQIFFNAV